MQDLILVGIYQLAKAVLFTDTLLLLAVLGFGVATGIKLGIDKK